MANSRRTSFTRRLFGVLAALQSAAHAAGAVESRKSPAPEDLERLGIDVTVFRAIKLN